MRKVLSSAGFAEDTLKLIRDVTSSCRQYREWQRPASDSKTNYDTCTFFNETCECDLLFYTSHIFFISSTELRDSMVP